MTEKEKKEILIKSKDFFVDRIISNHISNIEKLSKKNEFSINPFLIKYLANLVFGDVSEESQARALIYPRVLGTSINTTFGNQLQYYCTEVLTSYASTTNGIDIEFIDAIDGRKKYCQVKAGPRTINKDDVKTIKDHFSDLRHIARTNRLVDLNPMTDCVVGVLYGTHDELLPHYKTIEEEYPVYCGEDFWYRLTGDKNFYYDLINTFNDVASNIKTIDLDSIVNELANSIRADN